MSTFCEDHIFRQSWPKVFGTPGKSATKIAKIITGSNKHAPNNCTFPYLLQYCILPPPNNVECVRHGFPCKIYFRSTLFWGEGRGDAYFTVCFPKCPNTFGQDCRLQSGLSLSRPSLLKKLSTCSFHFLSVRALALA